jgi:D-serine dehydratase
VAEAPLLDAGFKGFPPAKSAIECDRIASLGWNLLAGDLPLPLAVLKRPALDSNIAWMQQFARSQQIDLAPHGKTTMSPQIFRRQLAAGAWGMTFATVHQLQVGVEAGVRRAIVAHQLLQQSDLDAVQALRRSHPGLQVFFLLDSLAQLQAIERHHDAGVDGAPFDVLLEVGMPGGRTGCRSFEECASLARQASASAAVRLVGIECYEGLGATGITVKDESQATALMDRVEAVASLCDAQGLFDADEVLVTAGGSAIFDLVSGRLRPALRRRVRGVLRSGCYVVHDHGFYGRMLEAVAQRRSMAQPPLQPALEVWAMVVSTPEPGLAILAVGKRDLSFDLALPVPIARAAPDSRRVSAAPSSWTIDGLNDHHAYLRCSDRSSLPVVGERVALGISHPCTTFDKWRWLPIVDEHYDIVDAVITHF